MRLHINPVLYFDAHERQVVKEALCSFCVLAEEGVGDFQRHMSRLSGELRLDWLLEMHRDLLELQTALRFDAAHWDREAQQAPEESSGLIAKPRQVCQMLSETRSRQVGMCEDALALVRSAMGVLQPIQDECRRRSAAFNESQEIKGG
jgi:hypothetical protein